MNDVTLRHFVALIATIICVMAYYSGYISHMFDLWWTVFGMLIVYGGIYKILDK